VAATISATKPPRADLRLAKGIQKEKIWIMREKEGEGQHVCHELIYIREAALDF
jgi:hypothetical protein